MGLSIVFIHSNLAGGRIKYDTASPFVKTRSLKPQANERKPTFGKALRGGHLVLKAHLIASPSK